MDKPLRNVTSYLPNNKEGESMEKELVSKEELQLLVDIHYLQGMDMLEIKKHLHDDHGVANKNFPIPSKTTKKTLRKGINATRREIDRLNHLYNDMVNEDAFRTTHIQPLGETATKDEEPESEEPFEDIIYEAAGMTFMDRLMYGFSRLLSSEDNKDMSDFERIRDYVDYLEKELPFCLKGSIHDVIEKGANHDSVSVFLTLGQIHPWFSSARNTTENLQIDATLLDAFLSAKSLDMDKGFELIKSPIYIDINEHQHGTRHIPGIIVKTMPDGQLRIFIAIEWKEQGYEAFMHWNLGERELLTSKNAAIDIFYESVDEDENSLSQEKMQMIMADYAPLMPEVEKVIASTLLYHQQKSESSTKREWLPITSPALLNRETKSKKKSNLKKTRSIFKVQRLTSELAGRGGGASGPRGPIDHIFTVSGHFRWQPYGKGRSKVKLIWIDEHEKGVGNRLYPENRPVLDSVSK